jgi:hypothetical protein
MESFKNKPHLVVRVPAPYRPSERDLIISTESLLIVHFDWSHTHFDYWETPEEVFEHARMFINDILNEKLIVGIKTLDGKPISSRILLAEALDEIQAGAVSYIRSWRGTYNRTYE